MPGPADTPADAATSVTTSPGDFELGTIDAESAAGNMTNGVVASESTASARPENDSVSLAAGDVASSRADDPDQPPDPRRRREQADDADPVQLPEAAQPGIVAFRRSPDQRQEAEPPATPPAMTSSDDILPNQGPGYRGPRYQGYPPQYHDGPEPDQPPTEYAAAPVADSEVSAPASKPQRGKTRQVSRLGRTRRPGPGTHESWGSAGDQPADHAM